MRALHYRVLLALLVYLLLVVLGGPTGRLLLYPVTMLVAFLHEFGHALGAIVTGGTVEHLQVSMDGSGYTVTKGGDPAVILMGGYLGSAVLGNLLFYFGARKPDLSHHTLLILSGLMLLAGLLWFRSVQGTVLLWVFALGLGYIALRTKWSGDVLMFFGLTTVLYIIRDFNNGPQSDLDMYSQIVGFFPSAVWMYIWLAIALGLSLWNIHLVFRR